MAVKECFEFPQFCSAHKLDILAAAKTRRTGTLLTSNVEIIRFSLCRTCLFGRVLSLVCLDLAPSRKLREQAPFSELANISETPNPQKKRQMKTKHPKQIGSANKTTNLNLSITTTAGGKVEQLYIRNSCLTPADASNIYTARCRLALG